MDQITEQIRKELVDGQLPCARAFVIARRLGVEPLQVGRAADAAEVRLSRCQLGLFGYGPKSEGKHRIVKPMDGVPPALATAIHAALGEDGHLSCAEAWRIARERKLRRLTISNAAEGLGVRIRPCQLGAFDKP